MAFMQHGSISLKQHQSLCKSCNASATRRRSSSSNQSRSVLQLSARSSSRQLILTQATLHTQPISRCETTWTPATQSSQGAAAAGLLAAGGFGQCERRSLALKHGCQDPHQSCKRIVGREVHSHFITHNPGAVLVY